MTQVGEILPSLTAAFQREFDRCIEKNRHRREPYFILATADWYANETQMKLVIRPSSRKPPMMLNTMCWRIDNKKGRVKELWVLPKDVPIDPSIPLGEVDEGIIQKAPYLPIFYN